MSSPASTPRLEALLDRLRRALVRQVLFHGIGTVVLAAGLWLLFMYWADRTLHLPRAIRVFHAAALVALPAWFGLRALARPLRKVPGREGVALLVGRARPETHDLLISALQLAPRAASASARPLIDRVVREAEEVAAGIEGDVIVDGARPRKRLILGLAAGAVALGSLVVQPAMAGIFLARAVGRDVSWPQRTYLRVEVPAAGDRLRVEDLGDELRVLAARGTDVPVLVHVDGVVPDEVTLSFDGGHETVLASGGTALFRTLLRSVQEDLSFHVTGGDDRRRLPRVVVRVLQPPDIGGVAWHVRPPGYSGLPETVVHGPDVEALAGSEVRVHILPDPADAVGSARLFPEDREVALEPAPFPRPETSPETGPASGTDAPESIDPDATPAGLAFDLVAEVSTRVRFDLEDSRGLANPDPGLFALTVIEDRRPEVLLLAPARAEFDVVLGGAVPLRARVSDDFGLARLYWDARAESNPDEALVSGELEERALDDLEQAYSTARDARLASVRLEVNDLGGESPLSEGQVVLLQVFAVDNREPEGNESPSVPVRLRVVSGDEYLRRLQDGLARASEQASRLHELGARELADARMALEALGGDDSIDGGGEREDLSALVNGARRVQGDARALGRELAGLTEGLLYSRIDGRATALLEALDAGLAQGLERSFDPAPWVDLSKRYGAGSLGQADVAGTLVTVVGLALAVSEEHGRDFADELSTANDAAGQREARKALERAVAAQEQAQTVLDELLVKLGEWDNFQSVLTLTRDILNRQKNLNQRTEKYAEDR